MKTNKQINKKTDVWIAGFYHFFLKKRFSFLSTTPSCTQQAHFLSSVLGRSRDRALQLSQSWTGSWNHSPFLLEPWNMYKTTFPDICLWKKRSLCFPSTFQLCERFRRCLLRNSCLLGKSLTKAFFSDPVRNHNGLLVPALPIWSWWDSTLFFFSFLCSVDIAQLQITLE